MRRLSPLPLPARFLACAGAPSRLATLSLCVALSGGASPAHASACGDRLLAASETCAACPADCTPASCTPGADRQSVRIDVALPAESKVTAATVRLAYRSDLLRLPREQGDAAVRARLLSNPKPTVLSAADDGYAVRVVLVRDPIEDGALAEIGFDRCAGARRPTAADLSCEVEGCAGLGGALQGCTCSATTR